MELNQPKYAFLRVNCLVFFMNDAYKDQPLPPKEAAWRMDMDLVVQKLDSEWMELTIVVDLKLSNQVTGKKAAQQVTRSSFKVSHVNSMEQKIGVVHYMIIEALSHSQGVWAAKSAGSALSHMIPQVHEKFTHDNPEFISMVKKKWPRWR